MPLDESEEAARTCVSGNTATNNLEAVEEVGQDSAKGYLPTRMDNPIPSPQSVNSHRRVARNVHQDTHLCQRCYNLDFERKFNSMKGKEMDEYFVCIERGTWNPTCMLCGLFAMGVPGHPAMFGMQRRIGPPQGLWVKCNLDLDTPGLVEYSFTAFPFRPAVEHWPLDLAQVNFDVLRAKFEHCKANHESIVKTCRPKRVPVKNLRVFNCTTKKLEDATVETKYAALSYVWGNPKTSDKYPRTIRDSLEVAQKLGLNYIWIDQLCIDQAGPHKPEQIRQMHHIYNNAELTIVAAAGYDSDYGIPGVNGKVRKRRDFQIGTVRIVESYSECREDLDKTTWASRGWTYQEEVFSNRLLIFTDREAWFTCAQTFPEAGREHDLGIYHHRFIKPPISIPKHCFQSRDLKFSEDIAPMVKRYSERTLTYEADVINAFSGCLGRFEQEEPPVYHLWGSPMPLLPPRGYLDGFLIGLHWLPASSAMPLRRRVGFPSWSWTGWIGVAELQYYNHYMNLWWHLYNQEERESCNPDVSVALELKTGERLDWSDFEKRLFLRDQPDSLSRFIFLNAWTMVMTLEFCLPPLKEPTSTFSSLSTEESGLYAVVRTIDGGEALFKASMNSTVYDPDKKQFDELEKGVLTGIFMPVPPDKHWSGKDIILTRKLDDYYERVGHAELRSGQMLILRDGSGHISRRWINPEFLQREKKEIRLG